MILLFIFDNISGIIMRESKIPNYRPKFQTPFYPWLPVLAVGSYCLLLFEMGRIPIFISAAFCITGWLSRMVDSRFRVQSISALMHIVERISALPCSLWPVPLMKEMNISEP